MSMATRSRTIVGIDVSPISVSYLQLRNCRGRVLLHDLLLKDATAVGFGVPRSVRH